MSWGVDGGDELSEAAVDVGLKALGVDDGFGGF